METHLCNQAKGRREVKKKKKSFPPLAPAEN